MRERSARSPAATTAPLRLGAEGRSEPSGGEPLPAPSPPPPPTALLVSLSPQAAPGLRPRGVPGGALPAFHSARAAARLQRPLPRAPPPPGNGSPGTAAAQRPRAGGAVRPALSPLPALRGGRGGGERRGGRLFTPSRHFDPRPRGGLRSVCDTLTPPR